MKAFFYTPLLVIWKYTRERFCRIIHSIRDLHFVLFQVLRFRNDDFDLE